MSMRCGLLTAVLLAGSVGAGAGESWGAPYRIDGEGEGAGPGTQTTAEAAATGEEALKAAYAIRRRSFKTEGAEKTRILQEAIAAYRKIMVDFAHDSGTAALAALRAGDLARGIGQTEEALELYEAVLGLHDPGNSGARALAEIGHILRRADRPQEALERYRAVLERFPGEKDEGSKALIWMGKIHRTQGDGVRARDAWRRLVDGYPESRKRVVQAFDLMALSHLDVDEVEPARALVEECRNRFEECYRSPKKKDQELARAISKMKAAARLEKMGPDPAPAATGEEPGR